MCAKVGVLNKCSGWGRVPSRKCSWEGRGREVCNDNDTLMTDSCISAVIPTQIKVGEALSAKTTGTTTKRAE